MAAFLQSLLFLFMVLLSLFLILIILLQRGKGGGLVGAFGGMGGNSAFGAKTGDVFMRITVVAAIIWFVACIGGRHILGMKSGSSLQDAVGVEAAAAAPAEVAPAADVAPVENAPATDAAPVENAPATDAAPAENAPAAETVPAE
ncbi:MAG: preprotein translocase subunit SecG [Thermoguttaceae bacterium]|nr:preprotein translocase subunit SecG [Thermoguttaceae bacterium]